MNSTSVTAVFGSEPTPKSECPAPAAAPVSEASGLAGVGPKVFDTLDPAQCNDRVDQNIDTAVKAAVNLVLPRPSSQTRPRLPRGGYFSTIALLIAAMPPPHVAMDLVLCEYSGSVATRIAATGTPVLAVDTRAPEYNPEEAGVLFYQGDLQDVALLRPWRRAISFPPCEHQARSSAAVMKEKALDGRTWWGMCLLLFCYCLPAEVVLVENPRTYWTLFYGSQSQVVQPFFFGDDRQKTTNLFIRGTTERIPWTNNLRNGSTSWRSVRLADDEQTNKFRCRLLPGMAAAIVDHLPTKGNEARPLDYKKEVEKMARTWFGHGLPLPMHYNAPFARSPDANTYAYQRVRGRGDGRAIACAEAPETLIPPDGYGSRPKGCLPFIPLKAAEIGDPLPKPFREAAEVNRQQALDAFFKVGKGDADFELDDSEETQRESSPTISAASMTHAVETVRLPTTQPNTMHMCSSQRVSKVQLSRLHRRRAATLPVACYPLLSSWPVQPHRHRR